MYAVVKTGGKQYRVSKDDVIVVEKLAVDTGSSIELDQVLMLDDGKDALIGTPLVDGARVAATVLDQARNDKVLIFKKKRRQGYQRLKGHRQHVTILRITDILANGDKASPAKAAIPATDTVKPAEPAPPQAAAQIPVAAVTPVEAPAETSVETIAEAPAVTPVEATTEAAAPAKKAAAKKATAKKAPAKKAAAKKTSAKKSPAKKAAAKKTEE
jgi:large subunit ribosomal protein L21